MDIWLILEVIAVAGNLAYTIYMMLNKRIGWLFGIAASLIGTVIFLHQNVFAQVGLNVFYAIMGIYGWLSWKRSEGKELPITHRTLLFHLAMIGVGVILAVVIAFVLDQLPEAQYIEIDGFVTGFSLLATWMLARRILENWAYWIGADAVAIWLYWQIDLHWYAGLYAIYVIISIIALVRWHGQWQKDAVGAKF
ncbi:MAG: nicotinamide riboside transporter PnuC [Bacteroidota bacterium]|nr:nicotinamide riboside transporter PnuC [Bacteroidota bacterium]